MFLEIYQEDIKRVEEEETRAQWQHNALKREQEDSELPQVLDYIKIKAEATDLEKKVRKVVDRVFISFASEHMYPFR